MDGWIGFKRGFTQEQEDAIWQFLLDHSVIQPNGYWGIQIYVRDVDDLWKRIYARKTGDFVRYDKFKKEEIQTKTLKKNIVLRKEQSARILSKGSWLDRVLLHLHKKLTRYLFKS